MTGILKLHNQDFKAAMIKIIQRAINYKAPRKN